MNSYTDVRILECNRLHSEEYKSGNNENYALWRNNLADILHLEPGDSVSVYGAFISERGAGQSSSIEIKGVELGEKHRFKWVTLQKSLVGIDRLDNKLPSRASVIKINLHDEYIPIRDDTLNFTISYYMVASLQNYLHLPRRWMYGHPDSQNNFDLADCRHVNGATETRYMVSNASSGTKNYSQTPAFYASIKNASNEILYKPNNDNARYTIMVRNSTYFTLQGVASEPSALPIQDLRDPENATYYPYKEFKSITIPAGFNSADYIATEITRQLQNIVNDELLYEAEELNDPYPVCVSKILESETYKAFNTGSVQDNTKDWFLEYFNLSDVGNTAPDKSPRPNWGNASGYPWLRQYQFVACKYPELYETGRLLNRNHAQVYTGILGTKLYQSYSGDLDPFVFDIPYNKQRVDEFKAFFDAQKLYPEIIENLNNPNASGYNPGNTIHNTRWCHINRWEFFKQDLHTSPNIETTQLGWGGYYFPRSWNPDPEQVQLCSLLLPMFFDESQSETYYTNPDSDIKGEYTYGCIGKVDNRIAIYPSRHVTNGWNSNRALYEQELFKPYLGVGSPTIEEGRKIGFDHHFNAPGMYYLLPLSGWAPYVNSNTNRSDVYSGIYNVPNASQDMSSNGTTGKGQLYDLAYWKKLLYLGADNPTLNWDGTNFSFSDFHTSLNRGNIAYAGDPQYPGTLAEQEAADVVYKINPTTDVFEYTPDKQPYHFAKYNISNYYINASGTPLNIPRINNNYQKWRIYDMLSGIFVEDFGVPENLWQNSLWGLLGFSYRQFHSTENNRLTRIQSGNANKLSFLTTNAEVVEGDTKIYSTNWAGTPMYNGMITTPVNQPWWQDSGGVTVDHWTIIYPTIIHKTESVKIIAENLPTRMIRGYYTIRSNILEGTPFIGGKVNNTTMPIIGVVDKINGDGDFYFGQESSLSFTITKHLRLASVTVMLCDPDGSYARCSEQSTILFKITKPVTTTFNVAQEILQQNPRSKLLKNI